MKRFVLAVAALALFATAADASVVFVGGAFRRPRATVVLAPRAVVGVGYGVGAGFGVSRVAFAPVNYGFQQAAAFAPVGYGVNGCSGGVGAAFAPVGYGVGSFNSFGSYGVGAGFGVGVGVGRVRFVGGRFIR